MKHHLYDETKGDYPNGNRYNEVNPYAPGDYRNAARIAYDPSTYNFFNAAVAMNAASGPPGYPAGPIWAIFDVDAVAREQWHVTPPYVDPDGYFFCAPTLAALAAAITNPYQTQPMDGAILHATVERYNAFVVEAGRRGPHGGRTVLRPGRLISAQIKATCPFMPP